MSLVRRLIRPELLADADAAEAETRDEAGWADDAVRLHAAESPWPALVDGPLAARANRRPPPREEALERALAGLYGVAPEAALAVADIEDGAERLIRALCPPGTGAIGLAGEVEAPIAKLAMLHGARVMGEPFDAPLIFAPAARALALAAARPDVLIVTDETFAEFADAPELAAQAPGRDNLAVLRSLSSAYGLAGARIGAIIAAPSTIALIARAVPAPPLPSFSVAAALAVIAPSRRPAHAARIASLRAERERLAERLAAGADLAEVREGAGPFVTGRALDPAALDERLRRAGVRIALAPHGAVRIGVGTAEENAALLAVFGLASPQRPHRRAELVRDTRETRIAVAVDLDVAEPRAISTGVPFYDHMLDQIATHGGFSLVLTCEGDVDIDAHHTIEDCALAFGAALSKALGERGVGRFGFSLPMDEAQGQVLVDLSGRPFDRFEGEFAATHIGAYPTQMTAHVFRSISQGLGAAIHVRVDGENDHHKTEVAFKAFGRALRQAIARDAAPNGLAGSAVDGAVPSSKGAL